MISIRYTRKSGKENEETYLKRKHYQWERSYDYRTQAYQINRVFSEYQVKRIKGDLKTVNNQIPVIRANNKDHKELKEDETSRDIRPILGAKVGPNVSIAT